MKLLHQFRYLKKSLMARNHFGAKGYCVDAVGLDADMIRKYVRYQEKQERQMEHLQLWD
jgi:putative transposase